MTLVHKNIIANYVGKLWGFVSVYLFIPLYVKILGIESYAIIGFYTVLLFIMFVADAGLSATYGREVARTDDKIYLGNLLITIERLYFAICTLIVFVISICAPLIAEHWLQSGTIPATKLTHYITLMGVSIALQLFTSLFNGGLMGMQKQVLANTIQICYSLFRSGVVVIPLYFFPNLYVYFIWQIGINLITLLFTRYKVWSFIKTNIAPVFSLSLLKGIWKFALGMMSMALISSLNTQIDKMLTSKYLDLTDFGFYSLAGTLAQVPSIITLPIAIALLPQLTRLAEEKKTNELKAVYHKYSYIINSLAIIITLIIFLHCKEFILLWLGDSLMAENIFQITRILIVGNMLLAFQYMPYHLSIANGHNLTNVKLGVICLIAIIPSLMYLIPRLGLVGAGIPWVTINFIAFLVLGYTLTKKFLPKQFKPWFLKDTIIPLIVTTVIGIFVYLISPHIFQVYHFIFYSTLIGLFVLVGNLLIFHKYYPETRILMLLNFIKNKKTNR